MKQTAYRDSLISCYAAYLCKDIARADILERQAYISRLDDVLKYDGSSKVAMLPEHIAFQQSSEGEPSEEVEHTVHIPNHG